jgi:hypothetical protein
MNWLWTSGGILAVAAFWGLVVWRRWGWIGKTRRRWQVVALAALIAYVIACFATAGTAAYLVVTGIFCASLMLLSFMHKRRAAR